MRAPLLALLFACAVATPAAADHFVLKYDASALGVVSLGTISVDATLDLQGYQIDAALQSVGLMSWFQRTNLTANATGAFNQGAVLWSTYDLDHHYARKHRIITMRAVNGAPPNVQIAPTYGVWGDPATNDEQRRLSRDPLSTVMAMAVDVNQSHRCAGDYPTFDGRFYYLLELGGGRIEHFEGGGYSGDVLKCALAYIPVAGFERNDRGRVRIPHGEVWFAMVPDSSFGPPVRIVTPLAAGGATIRLAEWHRANVTVEEPSAVAPDPQPAQTPQQTQTHQ